MLGAALAVEQATPRRLHAASQRRKHSHPGDDDSSHYGLRTKLNATAVKLAQTAETCLRFAQRAQPISLVSREASEQRVTLSLSF
jgi:hypothetical protein